MDRYTLIAVGLVLVGNGAAAAISAESAMHQIYSAIYIGSGAIVVALSVVVKAIQESK